MKNNNYEEIIKVFEIIKGSSKDDAEALSRVNKFLDLDDDVSNFVINCCSFDDDDISKYVVFCSFCDFDKDTCMKLLEIISNSCGSEQAKWALFTAKVIENFDDDDFPKIEVISKAFGHMQAEYASSVCIRGGSLDFVSTVAYSIGERQASCASCIDYEKYPEVARIVSNTKDEYFDDTFNYLFGEDDISNVNLDHLKEISHLKEDVSLFSSEVMKCTCFDDYYDLLISNGDRRVTSGSFVRRIK